MNRRNETLHDRFRKTAALLRRNRVREFGNYPDTQNRILSLLALDDGMSQRQLAYLLGIRPQSAGELLGKLEKSGQIRRESDEADGRVNRVFLTDEGKKTVAALAEAQEKEDVFDCLSDEEKSQLEALLGKIVDSHPQPEEDVWKFRGGHHGFGGPEGRMPEGRFNPWEMDGPQARPMPFHRGRRHPRPEEDGDFKPMDEEPFEI